MQIAARYWDLMESPQLQQRLITVSGHSLYWKEELALI